MATVTATPSFSGKNLIGIFALFTALCTIFALVASISDAWREHAEKSWPEANAIIDRCTIERHIPLDRHNRSAVWYIECHVHYTVSDQVIESRLRSRSTGAGWGGELPQMNGWVASHSAGDILAVRYQPEDPKHAVLTETDMPSAGPRTPNNLKLLTIVAVMFAVSFITARRVNRPSSV